MGGIFRLLALVGLLLILAIWILVIAVASDYNEPAVLLLGLLWLFIAIIFTWRTAYWKIKSVLAAMLILAMLIFGAIAWESGIYRTRVRVVVTRDVLEEVTRLLTAQTDRGEKLPDDQWLGLTQQLQEKGTWKGLIIPFEGVDKTIHFDSIPRDDEWGCRYVYRLLDGSRFELISSGPDRRFGTRDDLRLTESTPLPTGPRPIPIFAKPTGSRKK